VDAARQAALTDKRGLVEKNLQLTPDEAKKVLADLRRVPERPRPAS
jgi:hypothetical protein